MVRTTITCKMPVIFVYHLVLLGNDAVLNQAQCQYSVRLYTTHSFKLYLLKGGKDFP